LRNFNKQYLILAKFYINNASSISSQTVKISVEFAVTVVSLRSPQNVDVAVCVDLPQQFV